LGLDAVMQRRQVGRGGRDDGQHHLRVAAFPDDPAPGRVDAVVGADLAGQGVDQGGRAQDGGAFVGTVTDDDVAGPVGGGEQGQQPAQPEQADQPAADRDGGPQPAAVVAEVPADPV